ncbi:hypothetical protein IMG5_092650 [Ichthyophthirius multifiliis]|uniref:EF-hand domain-containing protein n=1 Tax=Ichthyophthirius multifiliis TaxID=5932 RepID=G0QRG3_ICHMU|nr:hypothetical protein IMG5_092650 [Ichthyophthirius multifiliis]EGR32198.1 hypothetical protein IMG5_092650 [Ichthyophthirius multifiliis]|eukprot:XP_004035684.1 hypothetical protein IMG5_092650 [Ichthyophthirius multifiliis]
MNGQGQKMDLSIFIEVLDYYNCEHQTKQIKEQKKNTIVWYIKIFKEMEKKEIGLETFTRQIQNNDQLNRKQFIDTIQYQLNLKEDQTFEQFLEEISLPNNDISFSKFEIGYKKELKANQILQDMRNMTKSNRRNISDAFINIDVNGDGIITKKEFLEMIPIINKSMQKDEIEYIFERMDLDNNGKITLDEFSNNILGKDALVNQIEFEQKQKEFYQLIQQSLIQSNVSFDELFLNNQEKKININELDQKLRNIGISSQIQQQYIPVIEDLTYGGIVFNVLRLKLKYDQFKDQNKKEKQNNNNYMEFLIILKKTIQNENKYFDDVFDLRRGYTKQQLDDLLIQKIRLYGIRYYQQQFDQFFDYFKDQYNGELNVEKLYKAFKETKINQNENSVYQIRKNYDDDDKDFRKDNKRRDEDDYQHNRKRNQSGSRDLGNSQKRFDEDNDRRRDDIKRGDYYDNNRRGDDYNNNRRGDDYNNNRRGDDYNNKKRDDYSNKRGDDYNNKRGGDYDNRKGDDYNNRRGDDYNNRRGDDYNNRRGDDYNNRRGDDYDNRRGDDYDRRRGDDYDRRTSQKGREQGNERYGENKRIEDQNEKQEINDLLENFIQNEKTDIVKKCELISLQDKLKTNRISLQDLVKENRLDKYNDGFIDVNDFFDILDDKRIKLSRKEADLIEQWNKNKQGMINYKGLDNIIRRSSRKGGDEDNRKDNKKLRIKKKEKKKSSKQELEDVLEDFRQDVLNYIQKKNVGIRYVFKRFDKDNDTFISYTEFINCIQNDNVVPSLKKLPDDLVENFFDQFDEDKEMKINLAQFTKQVYPNLKEVDIAPLLNKIKSNVEITSEDEIRKYFKNIDTDNDGKISYTEFSKYMKKLTKNNIEDTEIERLFQHFLLEKNLDSISLELFIAVIQDDHMNFNKIRQKIIEYKEKKGKSIKTIYDQYAQGGSITIQSLQTFFNFLGLNFNFDQLDELFTFIDNDGDGKISYEEFYNVIEKALLEYSDVKIPKDESSKIAKNIKYYQGLSFYLTFGLYLQ